MTKEQKEAVKRSIEQWPDGYTGSAYYCRFTDEDVAHEPDDYGMRDQLECGVPGYG